MSSARLNIRLDTRSGGYHSSAIEVNASEDVKRASNRLPACERRRCRVEMVTTAKIRKKDYNTAYWKKDSEIKLSFLHFPLCQVNIPNRRRLLSGGGKKRRHTMIIATAMMMINEKDENFHSKHSPKAPEEWERVFGGWKNIFALNGRELRPPSNCRIEI